MKCPSCGFFGSWRPSFYDTLHEGETALKSVQYTRDGSYLRLRGAPGTPREIDFPDGTIHRFDSSNRLIQIRSRFLKPDNSPANVVDISYSANDWTITTTVDGHERTHTVHFRSGLGSYAKLAQYVDLAAWDGMRARYTFDYSLVTVQRPCPHNDQIASDGLPLSAAVPLLTAVDATKALGKVDVNKLNHIFGQSKHKLDDFVAALGSREIAFDALQKGTQAAVSAQKITGKFEIKVVVNGFAITVRGAVVNGVARIGTDFR